MKYHIRYARKEDVGSIIKIYKNCRSGIFMHLNKHTVTKIITESKNSDILVVDLDKNKCVAFVMIFLEYNNPDLKNKIFCSLHHKKDIEFKNLYNYTYPILFEFLEIKGMSDIYFDMRSVSECLK